MIYQGKTPISLSLKKKKGCFSGEKYLINVEKNGYVPDQYYLDTTLSVWYFGNLLFGGLIGMLIVDPITGSMWKFDEENVMLNLSKK